VAVVVLHKLVLDSPAVLDAFHLLVASSWTRSVVGRSDNPNTTRILEYTKDKYNAKIIK
jgi:hypothetical protein